MKKAVDNSLREHHTAIRESRQMSSAEEKQLAKEYELNREGSHVVNGRPTGGHRGRDPAGRHTHWQFLDNRPAFCSRSAGGWSATLSTQPTAIMTWVV